MRFALLTCILACGEVPKQSEDLTLTWRLAGARCGDVDGARVAVEAGGLGVIAHGPCEQLRPLTIAIPPGRRAVRAVLFDRAERAVASGSAEARSGAITMRLRPGLRGSIWLQPKIAGGRGCAAFGVAAYAITLSRPWGTVETQRQRCEGLGHFSVEALLPGPWRIAIKALSHTAALVSEAQLDITIEPGTRLPPGELPKSILMAPQPGPRGAIELVYDRPGAFEGRCDEVGIDRLVLRALPGALSAPIQHTIHCGDELPSWQQLLPWPGRLDLIAEAYQDDRIFYFGRWQFLWTPGSTAPRLVLEPS